MLLRIGFGFLLVYVCHESRRNLIKRLLESHNKNIGPRFANVSIHSELYQLLGVEWQDTSLAWTSEESNVSRVWLPADEIWKPDIVVYNLINVFDVLGASATMIYVKVKHDGLVLWGYPMVYTASCSINVGDFPFDEQTCDLIFGSWNIEGTFLDLFSPFQKPDTGNFQLNEQWDLDEVKTIRKVNYYSVVDAEVVAFPEIHFQIKLKRKPLFYLFTQVIPSALITLVSFVGLFTPSQSDGTQTERISLGMNTLLTVAVFLMMVSDSMPKTSAVVPRMSLYFMMQMIMTTASIATAAVMMKFHYMSHNGQPMPRCLRWLQSKKQEVIDCEQIEGGNPKMVTQPGWRTLVEAINTQHERLTLHNKLFSTNSSAYTSGCPDCMLDVENERHQFHHFFKHADGRDRGTEVAASPDAWSSSSQSSNKKGASNTSSAGKPEEWRGVVYKLDLILLFLYTLLFFVFTLIIFYPMLPSPRDWITEKLGQ